MAVVAATVGVAHIAGAAEHTVAAADIGEAAANVAVAALVVVDCWDPVCPL